MILHYIHITLWEVNITLGTIFNDKPPFNIGMDEYHKSSSISRTKFPNLHISRLVLQLSLPEPLKSSVKSRMKM